MPETETQYTYTFATEDEAKSYWAPILKKNAFVKAKVGTEDTILCESNGMYEDFVHGRCETAIKTSEINHKGVIEAIITGLCRTFQLADKLVLMHFKYELYRERVDRIFVDSMFDEDSAVTSLHDIALNIFETACQHKIITVNS